MAAKRILVIEDEPGARDALESLLEEDGYAVCTAGTGKTGLERLRDFRPDTVVCDFYLPDIDGLQVIREIRSGSPGRVTIIVITAGGAEEETENALRREADIFLQKPIDLSKFRRALQYSPPGCEARGAASSPPGTGASNGRLRRPSPHHHRA
ncbi:MAG TPA: response regulator [Longimicrobiaceae bacterium]|nr:response regulator [Longimicrobiaceae bacterium]